MEDICSLQGEQFFTAASKHYQNGKRWPHEVCAKALKLDKDEFTTRFQRFAEQMTEPTQNFPELNSIPTKYREAVERQLERKRNELKNQAARREKSLEEKRTDLGSVLNARQARIQLQQKRQKRQVRRAGTDAVSKAQVRSIRGTTQQMTELGTQGSASAPWKRIIWVAFPDNPAPWNVKESKSLCIEILDSNREMGGIDWLNDNDLSSLERGLRSFFWKAKGITYLHQGLATMLIARSLSSVPIELHSWKWLERQLRDNASGLRSHLTDDNGQPVPAVIMLHCTTTKPENLFDVCAQIESLPSELSIRSFPKLSELRQDQEKHDWEVLDQIAARSTIPEYRFRPKTCPGRGDCLLRDKRVTVMKRAHSSGGAHIGYQLKSFRGFLQCDIGDESVEKKSDPDGKHWFHQEYVGSLDSREILVNIAMENDPKGILGLRGSVVHTVTTKRDLKNNLLSRGFEASDLDNEDCGCYTEGHLDKFALWIPNRILELPDALERFESLLVGVRLDVGFCHGSPFVNEISRFYNAHFYSLSGSAEPFTKMAKAMAISLLRYFGCLKAIYV